MTISGEEERPAVPRQLVTERILLSALRYQDAAVVAQAAQERAEFLSAAGLRFGASLDQELTYAAIAGVALPGLNAWCVVDIVELGGGLRRLAVVHSEEDERAVDRILAETWLPAADDPIGVPAVHRSAAPLIVPDNVEEIAAAAARESSTRRILQELDVGPLLVVPITTNGELVGAITFVGRPHAPAYTTEDISLAEALATRCAQALDGARLYAAARAAYAEASRAVTEAEAARAAAEAANATKTHFLSTMSHELRTPLNAIGGYAQLLELGIRGPVTPEQLADLGSIQRSQAHLLGLVDSVLNYAQVQAGRLIYTAADIPLVETVAGVHEFVAPQLAAKGLEYVFEGNDLTLIVRADMAKLRQIALNLLGNALKFTPLGGRITVSCRAGEPVTEAEAAAGVVSMHTVHVTDTGLGMEKDKLATVFDPFVQVGRTLTSSDSGVGLGLAISRELARGMSGDLTVESSPGHGSTFRLALPAA